MLVAATLAALAVGVALAILFQGPPPPEAGTPVYHTGEVVSVDSSSQTLTLREGLGTRAADVSVRVDSGTRITHAGVSLPLAGVQPGDHAIVRVVPPRSPAEKVEPFAQEIRLARAGEPGEDEASPEESPSP